MTALPPSGSRASAPGPTLPQNIPGPLRRLERLRRLSQLALFWEQLWPALWPVAGVACLYAAISLAGFWEAAPTAIHHGVRIGFLAAGIAALWPLVRLRWPSRQQALARLDQSAAGLEHARIASAFTDAQATGLDDAASRAMWRRHQAMLERQLARLRVRMPAVHMADRDRHALRAVPVLALVVAAFVAGPQWRDRLSSGFSWPSRPAAEAGSRLDGWIDPPRYTRRPPLMLNLSETAQRTEPVKVPVNSILVVQSAGADRLTVSAGSGLAAVGDDPAAPPPDGLQRARYRITGDGSVTIRAGGQPHDIAIEAIADAPPKVTLKGKPSGGARGALTIVYTATDDYGLASGHARILRMGGGGGRSLAAAPEIPLNLPANPGDGAELRTVAELASHPWAGAEVALTLVVKDAAGQEGHSETVTITLPERSFADPLARALVEQRRDLILTPDERERVQTALDALLIAPELFTPDPGVYLGLRRVGGQLRAAGSDADLLDVAGQLWQLALLIEDGDLSDAEKQLRQAEQALRDAIERGADPDEIRRLSQDLRRAMDRYVAEMGRQARTRPQQPANPDTPTITQDQLQKLLDRIEELTREGRREEAARLLDRLRQIMENLQTASPSQGGGQGQPGTDQGAQGQAGQRLGKALGDLDELMREQQALRDETFRQGQQQDQTDGQQGPDASPEGRPGQKGQQGKAGQPGPQNGATGKNAQGGPGDQDSAGTNDSAGTLRERQEALRRKLQDLQNQLKGDGAETEKGFGEADGDMRGAGEALGRESPGEAVDAQGRALDQLRRGAQDLARQMAEADGKGRNSGQAEGPGQPEGPDQPGASGQSGQGAQTDPLGRPLRGQDGGHGQLEAGEGGEAAGARARRILDELRRRLGDSERARDELDYLERLLRPR